jgi:hypothetical protein
MLLDAKAALVIAADAAKGDDAGRTTRRKAIRNQVADLTTAIDAINALPATTAVPPLKQKEIDLLLLQGQRGIINVLIDAIIGKEDVAP